MLKDNTWLTSQNEILTDVGWLDVENILRARYLIGVNECGNLQKTDILELNIIPKYTGSIISRFGTKLYISVKNILHYNDCLWRVGKCEDIPKIPKSDYSGKLYNIITDTNTLIFRSHTKTNLHNDDYIVALCRVK